MEIKINCSVCKGYGCYPSVYIPGIYVHCYQCNGTGYVTRVLEEFTEKKERLDSGNITVIPFENPYMKRFKPEDIKGGKPYEVFKTDITWIKGTEIQEVYCPKQFYQLTQVKELYENSPEINWEECIEDTFYTCPKWKTKSECWSKFYENS